jgi:glucose dehydrogenase
MRPVLILLLAAAPVALRAQGRSVDWPVYGGNTDNSHYSTLDQVTPAECVAPAGGVDVRDA